MTSNNTTTTTLRTTHHNKKKENFLKTHFMSHHAMSSLKSFPFFRSIQHYIVSVVSTIT